MCNVRAVRPRFSTWHFAAAAGLAFLATSCSSPAAPKPVVVVPTTNTGLCKLVSPSVVATAVEVSMAFPETLTHGSSTECVYKAKAGTGQAILIRYDTDSSESTFLNGEKNFERRGFQLGPITQLGDQAYYFDEKAGPATVTTVALRKGSLQVLVTGTGTLDQIGAIARYSLEQYEAGHPSATPSAS